MSTTTITRALELVDSLAYAWATADPRVAELRSILAAYRATAPAPSMCERCNGTGRQLVNGHESEAICRTCDGAGYVATAPAAGQLPPLTDEQIKAAIKESEGSAFVVLGYDYRVARAIEAAHGISASAQAGTEPQP